MNCSGVRRIAKSPEELAAAWGCKEGGWGGAGQGKKKNKLQCSSPNWPMLHPLLSQADSIN